LLGGAIAVSSESNARRDRVVERPCLGVPGALDAARVLGSEIDNPALAELLGASVPA
jgi:hypothetical protein